MYLHGDSLCQDSPGPKEAQCREQEGVHGSSGQEGGAVGSGCQRETVGLLTRAGLLSNLGASSAPHRLSHQLGPDQIRLRQPCR